FVELVDDALLVEQVGEGATNVDVGEEVGRDAVTVELAGADVLVVRGVDVEVEEDRGHRGGGPAVFLMHDDARGATQLDESGVLVERDAVGVTLLKGEDAGGLLVDVLVDDVLDGRSAAPVVVEGAG